MAPKAPKEGGASAGGAFVNLKHSKVHPKFLRSNATSHTWVFGAMAELLDNAMDPDVMATQFSIDVMTIKDIQCLVFMDNGHGLTVEGLYKMLGFGHSDKSSLMQQTGQSYIGRFGNGFKSGAMRIADDALVITKCKESQSVGLLSQTFLKDIDAEDVYIPMVSWDLAGNLMNANDVEVKESIDAFAKYSIFGSDEEILTQLESITNTGTMIILSRMRSAEGSEGELELEFDEDVKDIRIASLGSGEQFQQSRPNQTTSTNVPIDYSLRAYLAVLYKIPRMQIFLRGHKVKSKRMSAMLANKFLDSYKPHGYFVTCTMELGFNTESEELYGMMIYHNNRLIMPYQKVGMQLERNDRGLGVIGLVDADFLEPTHNKQGFVTNNAYRRLMHRLKETLQTFWWDKVERAENEKSEAERNARQAKRKRPTRPDEIWVQCEFPECLKWRKLPSSTDMKKLPAVWYCTCHPDKRIAESNHQYPEETYEEDKAYVYKESQKRKKDYQEELKLRRSQQQMEKRREEEGKNDEIAMLKAQVAALQAENGGGQRYAAITNIGPACLNGLVVGPESPLKHPGGAAAAAAEGGAAAGPSHAAPQPMGVQEPRATSQQTESLGANNYGDGGGEEGTAEVASTRLPTPNVLIAPAHARHLTNGHHLPQISPTPSPSGEPRSPGSGLPHSQPRQTQPNAATAGRPAQPRGSGPNDLLLDVYQNREEMAYDVNQGLALLQRRGQIGGGTGQAMPDRVQNGAGVGAGAGAGVPNISAIIQSFLDPQYGSLSSTDRVANLGSKLRVLMNLFKQIAAQNRTAHPSNIYVAEALLAKVGENVGHIQLMPFLQLLGIFSNNAKAHQQAAPPAPPPPRPQKPQGPQES